MSEFQIHILATDNALYQGPCESLIVPTLEGQYGILAGHSNMVSAIDPGILSYKVPSGDWRKVIVSVGIIKVEDNDVLILVDTAEYPEDIDMTRAREDLEAAREKSLMSRSGREYRLAQASLARAIARIRGAKGYGMDRMK